MQPYFKIYYKAMANYTYTHAYLHITLCIYNVYIHTLLENVGPKVTTWRGVIWPRDSLLPGERESTKGVGGRCLNTPQWDSAWSDWVGSYGSCWLEVGAEGGFKLDLRQDRDPGKQKLKGAVRTKTYRCHYCQHSSLFCLLKKRGVVFALASSSWQGAA
jgi:hypothetical protein